MAPSKSFSNSNVLEDMANNEIKLLPSQQHALDRLLDFVADPQKKIFILKGYAGTGKTTLMKSLISELRKRGVAYHLLASTGRAAKVLANATQMEEPSETVSENADVVGRPAACTFTSLTIFTSHLHVNLDIPFLPWNSSSTALAHHSAATMAAS